MKDLDKNSISRLELIKSKPGELDSQLDNLATTKEQLERGVTRCNAVIHSISDGVAVCNKDGKLELFNAAAEEILGIGLTEEDREKWSSIYGLYLSDGETPCPTDRLPLVRALNGEKTENFELVIKNNTTQKPVVIQVTGMPIFDEEGNNDGGVAIFKDITERKKAEEQVELQKQELAHMMRLDLMNEMASGMAHELNQPLSAIVNYVSGVSRLVESSNEITSEMREVMNEIVSEATRASEIIKGLRRLVAKRAPRKTKIQINKLVEKSIRICRIEAEKQNVEVWMDSTETEAPIIADEVQIEQVLVCLVMNSIEALKNLDINNRRIHVNVSNPESGHVQLAVTDNGPGIRADLVEKVFQPYFSTKSEGMGMGLAISRSIIESHGGRIWYEPNTARQSGFYISLPIASKEKDQT